MFESFAQRFVQTGGLVVRLPTGRDLVLGDAQSQASPLVVGLHDHMVAARVMRNPALHLGEAYMDGAQIIERGRFGEVSPATERAGLLVTDIEIMRLHYAETLRHWRERFASNRAEVAALYGYRRADERIREDVNDHLTDDHWLDASDVEVTVRDNEVTLAGLVAGRQDKRRAEDLATRYRA